MACDSQNMWTKRGRHSINCVWVKERDIVYSLQQRVCVCVHVYSKQVCFYTSAPTKPVREGKRTSLSAPRQQLPADCECVCVICYPSCTLSVYVCARWFICVNPHTHVFHMIRQEWLSFPVQLPSHFLSLPPRSSPYSRLSFLIRCSLPSRRIFSRR